MGASPGRPAAQTRPALSCGPAQGRAGTFGGHRGHRDPVGIVSACVNRHDSSLREPTVAAALTGIVKVTGPKGRPRLPSTGRPPADRRSVRGPARRRGARSRPAGGPRVSASAQAGSGSEPMQGGQHAAHDVGGRAVDRSARGQGLGRTTPLPDRERGNRGLVLGHVRGVGLGGRGQGVGGGRCKVRRKICPASVQFFAPGFVPHERKAGSLRDRGLGSEFRGGDVRIGLADGRHGLAVHGPTSDRSGLPGWHRARGGDGAIGQPSDHWRPRDVAAPTGAAPGLGSRTGEQRRAPVQRCR